MQLMYLQTEDVENLKRPTSPDLCLSIDSGTIISDLETSL